MVLVRICTLFILGANSIDIPLDGGVTTPPLDGNIAMLGATIVYSSLNESLGLALQSSRSGNQTPHSLGHGQFPIDLNIDAANIFMD